MRIETLAIGDELLDGRVVDTNASGLARELRLRNLKIQRMSVCPDSIETIAEMLADIGQRADLVICSGGLGPTSDDCTRDAAAHWLGAALEHHEDLFEHIKGLFAQFGVEITPNNRRQASVPSGATVLHNEVGTAPGFEATGPNGLRAWFLPGVPREYTWFLKNHVLQSIVEEQPATASRKLMRRTMVFFGVGESSLEDRLKDIVWPSWLMLGYRAHFPEIHVTVSAWENTETGASEAAFEALGAEVMTRLGRFHVADGEQTLVERVAGLLRERGESIACAESCTGGLIAAALTSVSGSSAYLDECYVTYSNAAKVKLVGVSQSTLDAHGAVSREVALEMARGARASSGATYGLSVTGVAGPTGGSKEKPVGTVDLALDTPQGTWARRLSLRAHWGRTRIRQGTVHHALAMLLKVLEERPGDDPKLEGPWLQDSKG